MKNLKEKISNPIIRAIIVVLWYIAIIILLIPAIPYTIIRGVGNIEYYEDWFDFINK